MAVGFSRSSRDFCRVICLQKSFMFRQEVHVLAGNPDAFESVVKSINYFWLTEVKSPQRRKRG
jgi:hypothetical protein